MSIEDSSRRQFLKTAAATARNSLVILSVPSLVLAAREASQAQAENRPFTILSEQEAAEFQAIAARIIPTDETPGAAEAGVIYFMDNVLGNSRAEALEPLRAGLRELQTNVWANYSMLNFSELNAGQQDALLHSIEDTPFFATLRYLTIAGMFSNPSHGGNRDKIGWQLIGFEDRHYWQAPYGYYDADYMEKGE